MQGPREDVASLGNQSEGHRMSEEWFKGAIRTCPVCAVSFKLKNARRRVYCTTECLGRANSRIAQGLPISDAAMETADRRLKANR